jgi:hypothetical protein
MPIIFVVHKPNVKYAPSSVLKDQLANSQYATYFMRPDYRKVSAQRFRTWHLKKRVLRGKKLLVYPSRDVEMSCAPRPE